MTRGITAEKLLKASLWFQSSPELITIPVRFVSGPPLSVKELDLELRSTILVVADVVEILPLIGGECTGKF